MTQPHENAAHANPTAGGQGEQDAGPPQVLTEVRGHLGVITLNRPKAANALTLPMVLDLIQTLVDWKHDSRIAQVLIRGAGDKGLCAGGDIVAIYRDLVHMRETGGEPLATERFWRDEYALNALIASYPKPYIAFMQGLTLGGGIGISAHGSHRIVTDSTRAGMPETGIGYVPDVGGTFLLSRSPGCLGTYAALTGAHLDAADTIELGLADRYVPEDVLEDLATALETEDADTAVGRYAQASPPSSLARNREWIDVCFNPIDVDKIVDRLREDKHEITLETVLSKCPVSLKLTRQLLFRGAERDLAGCLQDEYTVGVRLCSGPNFIEGIRAQVIDKDRNPQWVPASLEQVSDEEIRKFFIPDPALKLDLRWPLEVRPRAESSRDETNRSEDE